MSEIHCRNCGLTIYKNEMTGLYEDESEWTKTCMPETGIREGRYHIPDLPKEPGMTSGTGSSTTASFSGTVTSEQQTLRERACASYREYFNNRTREETSSPLPPGGPRIL